MKLQILTSSILCLIAIGHESRAQGNLNAKPKPIPTAQDGQLVVPLSPSSQARQPPIRFTVDKSGHPQVHHPPQEKMVSGRVTIDGEGVLLFVPAKGPYSFTSKTHHSFTNTSTALSIDSNHNGTIDSYELWWSSLPIRLGDRMFTVRTIDPGASWILVEKSPAPLAGAVVGKPMVQFNFKTTNGKDVSLDTYKDKWLLLDTWSFT